MRIAGTHSFCKEGVPAPSPRNAINWARGSASRPCLGHLAMSGGFPSHVVDCSSYTESRQPQEPVRVSIASSTGGRKPFSSIDCISCRGRLPGNRSTKEPRPPRRFPPKPFPTCGTTGAVSSQKNLEDQKRSTILGPRKERFVILSRSIPAIGDLAIADLVAVSIGWLCH